MTTIIGAVAFGSAAVIYLLLICGAPLGEFALGGKYKVLPGKYRVICAVSVVVQLFAVMIILQTGRIIPFIFTPQATRIICFIFAGYLSLNVVTNFLSKSKKEKWVTGPLSLITAVCFWLTPLLH